MMIKTLLLFSALTAPMALRAQTPPPTAAPAPQASPAIRSLEDDPDFKKLSPEMQEQVRKFDAALKQAIANDKNAAAQSPYIYADPKATPAAKTATCATVPVKKPGWLAKAKQHVENTVKGQAAKADAQIAKASKGSVDAGVADTATTAMKEADQAKPCPPAAK